MDIWMIVTIVLFLFLVVVGVTSLAYIFYLRGQIPLRVNEKFEEKKKSWKEKLQREALFEEEKKELRREDRKKFEKEKKELRRQTLERSRATLKGKVAEQIVPFLKEFHYHPADARFIGAPIDYMIFDGYSENKMVTVVLVDIKTGKRGYLTPGQRKIKDAVDKKRVKWETIHLK